MYLDVVDLNEFYRSDLGATAASLLAGKIRARWPAVAGARVLGLGFCTPFLTAFLDEAERVVAVMPAPQGVVRWPSGRANLTALGAEDRLPLPDASFDYVLLAHLLENSESVRPLIREVWRVMAPEARLIILVPNRTGFWCRLERTPFGWGHPYSRGQLRRFLSESMLVPLHWDTALYAPPVRTRIGVRVLEAAERVGQGWLSHLAGILMVEAEKRIIAQPTLREPAFARRAAAAIRRR